MSEYYYKPKPSYNCVQSCLDMRERILEERKTKYGKRVVKQIEGKIIVEKIKEDKVEEVKKKPKRKKKKNRNTTNSK